MPATAPVASGAPALPLGHAGRFLTDAQGRVVILHGYNMVYKRPPYAPDAAYHGTSAALEFGVRVLEVPHLIVLGHGLCGGVRVLLEGAPDNAFEFVAPWMSIAEPAKVRAVQGVPPEMRQQYCEFEVVKVSLANLMTFPWIAERVTTGKLALHGAWFSVHAGVLMMLQEDGSFTPAAD